jgi:hypothetical protein
MMNDQEQRSYGLQERRTSANFFLQHSLLDIRYSVFVGGAQELGFRVLLTEPCSLNPAHSSEQHRLT